MAINILELTEDNFEKEVLRSDKPVIVDFWAAWCMPCKMMSGVLEEVAKEYHDRCKVAKLNIDDAMDLAAKFEVMNIPTLIFFKHGSQAARIVGMVSKTEISRKIEEAFD